MSRTFQRFLIPILAGAVAASVGLVNSSVAATVPPAQPPVQPAVATASESAFRGPEPAGFSFPALLFSGASAKTRAADARRDRAATEAAKLAAAQSISPMTGAALTNQFATYGNTSGAWSGGDSTASVALPDGRVVWLFSDSMIGAVNPDFTRSTGTPMVNNSMVVQKGTALTTMYGGFTSEPSALVKASQEGEFLWVVDGLVANGTLRVLYNRYRKTGSGALDVELRGTTLATFSLPSLEATSVVDLPLGSTVAWGSGLVDADGYTYIYGSEYDAKSRLRFAKLARVPFGQLGGAWQFWTGSAWSGTLSTAARLPLSGVGSSFGVQKVGSQYVVVTVEANVAFNSQVVAYTASQPYGPFTGPIDLFTAPEPNQRSGVIVYDARLHPELAPSGRLLVSYNVHSLVPQDLYRDARIYRPRFVDVAWPRPVPDPAVVPAAPTNLTATFVASAGQVSLVWPAAARATGYNVYQRDVTSGQSHFVRISQPTGTTVTLGGLSTGHQYQFQVRGRNATGEGPTSSVQTAAVTIPAPPAPTGITATPHATNGTVTVAWKPVANAWTYTVYRRDVSAAETTFTTVADLDTKDTTARAADLKQGHQYEFVVTATNGGGESARSVPARATAKYVAPPAPTNLSAVPLSNGSVRLTWGGSADVYYWIYERNVTRGRAEFLKLPYPVSCCQFDVGFLAHGDTYEFKVIAANLGGESPASNLVRATSHYPAPAAPSNLRVVPGNAQVTLTWEPSATVGTWYWVYSRDVTAGETAFTRLPLPISQCCTMTAGYLSNSHAYEFKVTAVGLAGESAATNVGTATPLQPKPRQVTGLVTQAQSNGSITLTWTAPEPDVYYWVYQRDVSIGQAFQKLPLPVGTCCTFTADLLTHRHVYEFKIAATNLAGDGPASAVVASTSTYAIPGAPKLGARAIGGGQIELSWNAVAPRLMYWIYYRDATAGAAWQKATYPTDKTFFTMGSLVNAHRYEFKVSAQSQGGEGVTSAVVSATSTGGLPLPPSGLSATAGDSSVSLRWSASATANVYYWIEYRAVGGSWQRAQYPISACCAFNLQGLGNGTTYEFVVRATNSSGDSGASNLATARPLPPLPLAPTYVLANMHPESATLTWGASSSPDSLYWIEYRKVTAVDGRWTRIKLPAQCCEAWVTGLESDIQYQFRVFAGNLAGDSAQAAYVTGRTLVSREVLMGAAQSVALESVDGSSYYVIKKRYPYSLNWTSDGCSVPEEVETVFNDIFEPACLRHDFGYRNFGDKTTTLPRPAFMPNSEEMRNRIDVAFGNNMLKLCTRFTGGALDLCNGAAYVYYAAVYYGGKGSY